MHRPFALLVQSLSAVHACSDEIPDELQLVQEQVPGGKACAHCLSTARWYVGARGCRVVAGPPPQPLLAIKQTNQSNGRWYPVRTFTLTFMVDNLSAASSRPW